ncbi:MAG: CRTAC1 family protein, partial [Bryobacteraceae bacterium]
MKLTRRELIKLAALSSTNRLWGLETSAAHNEPLFVQIPPSVSGIHWIHDNAKSPEHYLPETLGPGC